jgi:hypothetical protein
MNNNIGAFTVGDARHIHKEIFGTRMSQPPMDNTRDKTIHNLLYYALLLEDLAAATNPLTGYTQAQIRVIRYVQPGDGVTLNMEESTTTTGIVQVTNRFESFSASAGDLLLVIRNGSEWSPVNSGSGGTHEIWFRIVSVECVSSTETILTVEPTWYTGGCTKDIPGADPYTGYVTVEDVCSILRFYTTEWLESGGVVGRATYMYPRAGYCTPTWLVDTICGGPEC